MSSWKMDATASSSSGWLVRAGLLRGTEQWAARGPSRSYRSALKQELCGLWVRESVQAVWAEQVRASGQWTGKLTALLRPSGRQWGRSQAWERLGRLDSVSRPVLEVSVGVAGLEDPSWQGREDPRAS